MTRKNVLSGQSSARLSASRAAWLRTVCGAVAAGVLAVTLLPGSADAASDMPSPSSLSISMTSAVPDDGTCGDLTGDYGSSWTLGTFTASWPASAGAVSYKLYSGAAVPVDWSQKGSATSRSGSVCFTDATAWQLFACGSTSCTHSSGGVSASINVDQGADGAFASPSYPAPYVAPSPSPTGGGGASPPPSSVDLVASTTRDGFDSMRAIVIVLLVSAMALLLVIVGTKVGQRWLYRMIVGK